MPRTPIALALAAALLAPAAARAGPYDGQPLDTYWGPLLGDGRVVGMGGAFVGVAEGLGGAPVNPASVAQRRGDLDRTWDGGFSFTYFVPPPGEVAHLDSGNDGRPDAGLSGIENLQLGVSGQAGRLGAGILGRAWAVQVIRPGTGEISVSTSEVALSVGWSGLADSLVAGVGLTATAGETWLTTSSGARESLKFAAGAIRLGALWRPRGLPFRVGASFDPGGRARPTQPREGFPVTTPSSFAFPWIASAGASAWIGPNAARYNEPPALALALHPDWGEGPPYQEGARAPVLVSAQLDVIGPTPGAVGIDAAFSAGEAVPSGRRPSLVPRAGAEWEAVQRWMRIRGGSYLEPSRTGTTSPRAHATFGMEGRIPFWPWDLQLALTGDVASRYRNVAMSIGFWSDYGPARPKAIEVPAE